MAKRTKPRLPRDPYWEVVQSLMQNILTIYEAYRDKKPVMLFDMQEHRSYVYPYLDFKNDLSVGHRGRQRADCGIGSIDGWIDIEHGPLTMLGKRYVTYLGKESYFETTLKLRQIVACEQGILGEGMKNNERSGS